MAQPMARKTKLEKVPHGWTAAHKARPSGNAGSTASASEHADPDWTDDRDSLRDGGSGNTPESPRQRTAPDITTSRSDQTEVQTGSDVHQQVSSGPSRDVGSTSSHGERNAPMSGPRQIPTHEGQDFPRS